jgi:RNA polymerase sigma-70 factor, ECF subfamily
VDQLEQYRVELTALCNRMLGPVDGEDAVQETFVRALRNFDRFERRGTLRSWLYRIATNVCFDMLDSRKRRARSLDFDIASGPTADSLDTLASPHSRGFGPEGDPADVAESREAVRLALIVAVRHLSPKQRSVLILCEVLRWKASEVAELLETSVTSVSSALQRARATLKSRDLNAETPISVGGADSRLLGRYVRAFERYDMDALTELIRADTFGARPPAETSIEEMWPVARSPSLDVRGKEERYVRKLQRRSGGSSAARSPQADRLSGHRDLDRPQPDVVRHRHGR